jgi:CBS domain-containing protein
VDPVRPIAHHDTMVSDAGRSLLDVMRPVVWCGPEERVRDVAARIGAAGHSCGLVNGGAGLAIVTDHDFRARVGTGQVEPDAPVTALATQPVITIDRDATLAGCLVRMVEHGVHHVVVTDQDDRPVGIIRSLDLAHLAVRDPLAIRAAIDAAPTIDALAEAARGLVAMVADLHHQGLSAQHVGAVHAAVVDAIVRRAIVLRQPVYADLPRASWVVLGSMARREPLPRSDLDTALIWVDPAPTGDAAGPGEALRAAADATLDDLERCGLRRCANGANASNPLFSRSQAEWHRSARGWITDPTRAGALLLSAMIADSRPVTEVELGRHLTDSIRSHTRTRQFLQALLEQALAWRTQVGLVRPFVVAHRGPHRGHVDLKRVGLMPVVSLGRWVAIATGDAGGTTPERLSRGVGAGLLTRDEGGVLSGAFESLYRILLAHELEAHRAGVEPSTFIDPATLDSLTRRTLRQTLRAVGQVQRTLEQQWSWRLSETLDPAAPHR